MKSMSFRAHPLTIFNLIRSYWLVFVAPPIRITVQYITNDDTQVILLSEIFAVLMVLLLAVLSWFFTKITVIGDRLVIQKDFLIKSCNVISLSRNCAVYIRQNLTDVIFKSATLHIKLETDESEKKVFKIKINTCDMNKMFNKDQAITIRPVKSARNMSRFFIVPMVMFSIILIGLLAKFQYVGCLQIILLLTIGAYYAGVCYHNYIKGRLCIKENIFAVGSKGLSIFKFCCRKENVGIIKILQTPADRMLKTCKIKIIECGAGAKGLKISNTNFKETILIINKSFNLNINA